MKKVLPVLSVLFAVALILMSFGWIFARSMIIGQQYNIVHNTLLESILLLVVVIIHSLLIYSNEIKWIKILLLAAVLPLLWASVLASPSTWSMIVSVCIYIIACVLSKDKLTKIGVAVIVGVIVIALMFISAIGYILGPSETVSTEEYISPDGAFVVVVETILRNENGASDTFVRYRMNESIDGIFFDLLPNEKSLAEFVDIGDSDEPIWKSDDAFALGEKEYHLSKYEWK